MIPEQIHPKNAKSGVFLTKNRLNFSGFRSKSPQLVLVGQKLARFRSKSPHFLGFKKLIHKMSYQ